VATKFEKKKAMPCVLIPLQNEIPLVDSGRKAKEKGTGTKN